MAEFLGTAAPSQLLILMAFPLVGAALLTAFLVFFFVRRRQKPEMKHGIPLTEPAVDQPASEPAAAPPATVRPKAHEPAVEELGLRLDLLNKRITPEEAPQMSPASPPPQAVEPAPTTEPVELARLLRDPDSGQLIVAVGEQRYTKLADITDKKMGQFILKLAAQLLAFTNGMTISEAGVKSGPAPKVGPAPEPIVTPAASRSASVASAKTTATEPPIPKPSPEAEAAFLASLQTKAPEPEPVPAPGRGFFGRSAPTPTSTLLPTLNLAKEINTIVQARLVYAPLPENTKVEVISALDGGIRINVNGTFYESPDEITDPEVKKLIKESIKQWERG